MNRNQPNHNTSIQTAIAYLRSIPHWVCWRAVERTREYGVPKNEDGPRHWSLDHLFLDQDGVPTLIEVKRQEDSRIRREVIGQMLDYAANAVVYWPVNDIRATFEAQSQTNGENADQLVAELLGADPGDDAALGMLVNIFHDQRYLQAMFEGCIETAYLMYE